MTIYAIVSVHKNLKGAVIMKKKIISMLMITSLSIALIGCGAEATYVNPVTGEAMDKEEQKELQEMRDELSKLEGYDEFEAEVLGNNNYDEVDEEQDEEETMEVDEDEVTLDNYLGKELGKGSGMGYKYVLYEKGATVSQLELENIPSEITTEDGEKVPVIGLENSLYSGSADYTTITIPAHIKYIGENVFWNNITVEEIIIPDTVEALTGDGTFTGCNHLKTVSLPTEVEVTDKLNYTFKDCINLEKVVLPRGYKEIVFNVFDRCEKMTECVLNDDLEIIDCSSFGGLNNLNNLEIPASVTYMKGGFKSVGIKNIVIPDTVKELENFWGFENCPNLETIEIGEVEKADVFDVNDFAKECPNLKKVILPKNVGDVEGEKVLKFNKDRLPSLTELYLPDGLTELDLKGFENGELTVYIEESVIDFLSQKYPGVNFVAR